METNKLSCIIVDDEPMALSLMESYVNKTPFLSLKQKCNNGIDALHYLQNHAIDIAFLDIQMPELDGLTLSKQLPKHTKIIFTTAFNEYAIEGYKVEAVDYLLKPFDYDEFLAAATRAKNRLQKAQDFIFVKAEYKQIKIDLPQVLYFEGLKDYIKIWLKDEKKPILTLMSFKSLEKQLPENNFMRVHRSYIVSLKAITKTERGNIFIGEKQIPVSNLHKEDFNRFLQKNSPEK